MVVPPESSHFGPGLWSDFWMSKNLCDSKKAQTSYYQPGQDQKVVDMTELPVYTEDRIGLKEMNENGQIIFLDTDGDHLAITEDFFAEEIVPFLE